MKKQIGIIGLGYLGKYLAQAIKDSYRVIGLTKSSQPEISGIDHINMDLDNIDSEKNIWSSDILVLSFPPSKTKNYIQTIKNIKSVSQSKIIMISSVSAYAPDQGDVNEASPVFGKQSIIDAEAEIDSKADYILRLGGIVGPNRYPWKYLEGRSLAHDEYLHLVHIDDCVQAVQVLLENNPDQRIINIVNSQRILKSQFYSQKCKAPPTFGDKLKNAKKISNQLSIQELGINYKEI